MKILVALSGGMDSASLLAKAKLTSNAEKIIAYGFRYGSKHNRWELPCATNVAKHFNVPFSVIDVCRTMNEFKSDLLYTGGAIPEGHYEAESMKRTVVPGRNTIFTSILAGLAESHGFDHVWLGIHAGDHAIYPDCRPEWLNSMHDTIWESTEGKVVVEAPFLRMTKAEIVKQGTFLDAPYHLTRTCYKDQAKACGRCGSCQERLEAFFLNGIADPLEYETRELLPR